MRTLALVFALCLIFLLIVLAVEKGFWPKFFDAMTLAMGLR